MKVLATSEHCTIGCFASVAGAGMEEGVVLCLQEAIQVKTTLLSTRSSKDSKKYVLRGLY